MNLIGDGDTAMSWPQIQPNHNVIPAEASCRAELAGDTDARRLASLEELQWRRANENPAVRFHGDRLAKDFRDRTSDAALAVWRPVSTGDLRIRVVERSGGAGRMIRGSTWLESGSKMMVGCATPRRAWSDLPEHSTKRGLGS